jgi:ribose transport system permease protein
MSQTATLAAPPQQSTASDTYLFVPIVLMLALLVLAVLRTPNLVTSSGIGGAIIVATPLVLATYAVMALAIAGRGTVDLSIGPLIGFINVTLVQLYGAHVIGSPITFFLWAAFVGVSYQVAMALIIIFIRVQPIIVSLSGYLALSGINLVIMARPGGTTPDWMSTWGQGTSVWSPVLVVLVLSTVAWLLFTLTPFYGHLRLMGSDERAAYTSGVRINIVRLGAHVIAGLYAALAAITYTSLISSGDPTQGTTYTLIAITALVLGGASLAGGRGGAIGSLLGALNLYLITAVLATFNFGAVQSFVTDLSYGVVLVASLLLTLALPFVRRLVGDLSPMLFFVICSLITLGVILHATYDYAPAAVPTAAASKAALQLRAPLLHLEQSSVTLAARDETVPFEQVQVAPAAGTRAASGTGLAWPVTAVILLLLATTLALRIAPVQARATPGLAPLVHLVLAAVILLGIFTVSGHAPWAAGRALQHHLDGKR